MNVYDFDGTIYKGDSTIHFYKFLLKKHKRVLITFPLFLYDNIRYRLHYITKTQMKETFYMFLLLFNEEQIDELIKEFWDTHRKNIFPWYKERQKDDDVVISASSRFLLTPICKELKIKNLIASEVDKVNGKYTGVNCYGKEKVRRFCEVYKDGIIDEFYTDSFADTPLAKISKKAYMISKEGVVNDFPWND